MLPPAQPQQGQQAPPRQITSSPDTAAAGPSIVRVLEAELESRVSSGQSRVTCHVSRVQTGHLLTRLASCTLALPTAPWPRVGLYVMDLMMDVTDDGGMLHTVIC